MATNAFAVNQATATFQGAMEMPPEIVAEGNPTSETWVAREFEVSGKASAGIWAGEPGKINMPAYPFDEMFTVLEGRIEMTNEDGSVVSLGPGESGFLPKGWTGVWHVVEPTKKYFFSIA